jgi:hypothetical protein
LDNDWTFGCNSLNSSKKELSPGKLGMGIALQLPLLRLGAQGSHHQQTTNPRRSITHV